ncbi:MAG: ABC transporter permease [Vitreoscilla sp.]|nr:ABC transporter permease [Vitreoscilla sp.]
MKRSSWQIQKAVLFALILRELKTRFGGRLIGLLWVLFEPMAHIAVMLALRIILRERTAGVMIDVAVYLVVAMIPFFMFRNIWFRMMQAVEANAGLFGYRQVKPADAMASRAIIEIVMYTMIFVAFMLVFAWMEYRITPARPLEYLAMILLFVIWGVGLGLMSAVGVKKFPALGSFLQLTSFPLYISSGVLIPIHNFPPTVIQYLMWNPLLHMVELTRWSYFPTYHPLMGVNLDYPLVVGMVLLFLGVAVFWVNRQRVLVRR